MGEVLPLPNRGEVFLDPRGEGRSLRVSWHRHESTLVLSLWQLGQCRATFRLPTSEVPNLVHALVSGLADGLTERIDAQQQLSALITPALWAQDEPPTVPQAAEPGKREDKPESAAAEPPAVPPAVIFLAPPEPS
jgi:hypothetical protein